jgi:aspartate aminotransferase
MAVAKKIKAMMEQSSWIRKMFEIGNHLKAQYGAEKVCDFSLGNPNLPPPAEFSQTLRKLIEQDIPAKHGYMPNAGYPAVRETVARFISREYGVKTNGEQVIMTCGAGGALNIALKTIINPGDKILVSTPYFMEYNFYVDNHGGKLETVPGREDFDLDVEAILARIDQQTAGIIINSPNNPSGRIYPEATIKALSQGLVRKSRELGRTIYLISDEPYRKLVYDNVHVPSLFKHYPDTLIATSFSKDLSIPGERIGWLAVHPEAEDRDNLLNGLILCNRILGYVNAPALMQRAIETLLDKQIDVGIYQRKRDLLVDNLLKQGYKLLKPQGTFYLFPLAPGGDDIRFVDLLQQELVLAVPGRGFGLPGYFRIAYCVTDEVIERSLKGFEKAIKKI